MFDRMRLFVAMDIPEDVRAAVAALVAPLRSTNIPAGSKRSPHPGARWARIEGLHVTLKFIGEIPEEKVAGIVSALKAVAFAKPIPLNFRGMGFFPNERRPRVLWVGIEPGQELAALAKAVETALIPVGITREERAFSPHLTLARFDSPRGLDRLHAAIEAAGSLEFGSAISKEFHLYQSVLKRGGAEYTRVATFACARSES
jgi:RNA 2',3'-cyclic 3'-phosphodiesterase